MVHLGAAGVVSSVAQSGFPVTIACGPVLGVALGDELSIAAVYVRVHPQSGV